MKLYHIAGYILRNIITYISNFHFLFVVHTVDRNFRLRDEMIISDVIFQQQSF